MAKIDLTSKDWCELIFKDRNKAYGAYDMRLDTPKRHNMATLIVVIAVILVITLPMLIKFITPERENKIVVNEVTTLAKLPEAEIKRNEELRPMMKPTTPPPPLKSTIKFTAPVIKKDEEVGEEDEIKSQDELAARGNVAISIADVKGNDEIDGQDIADFKDFVAPEVEEDVECDSQLLPLCPERAHRVPVRTGGGDRQGRVWVRPQVPRPQNRRVRRHQDAPR